MSKQIHDQWCISAWVVYLSLPLKVEYYTLQRRTTAIKLSKHSMAGHLPWEGADRNDQNPKNKNLNRSWQSSDQSLDIIRQILSRLLSHHSSRTDKAELSQLTVNTLCLHEAITSSCWLPGGLIRLISMLAGVCSTPVQCYVLYGQLAGKLWK